MINSWKQHLEIIVFQLQIKADIALPDMSSTIGLFLINSKPIFEIIY